MKKKNQLKSCCKNSLSSREVVARDLPHPMPLFNEKKQSCFTEEVEDPRQKLSGMTTYFYNDYRGFTLIELLVVVLIIGILAAVALPQYQKAVWKSRNVQLKTMVTSLGRAQEAYKMANGTFAANFDELDVEMPLEKISEAPCALALSDGTDNIRQGKDFRVIISENGNITAMWMTGPYQCSGFQYNVATNTLRCAKSPGVGQGDMCTKIEHGTAISVGTLLYYQLP